VVNRLPVLIIFGGLPGTGKTTLARELARQTGAVFVRIDSIEEAIRESGVLTGPIQDAGYRAAYAIAEDNLRAGLTVVADSVNPLRITRAAWRAVAERAGAQAVEIEVCCSDAAEHRRRVESRPSPTWQEVLDRAYEPWEGEHLVIDTAGRTVEDCIEAIRRFSCL
jgi:predicted kinase